MGTGIKLHALVVAGAFAALLAYPALGLAGTYEVGACTESVGYVNRSWMLYNNSPGHIEASSACHQPPTHELSAGVSNLAVADIMGTGNPPVGVDAGWSFTAPAGTKIVEVTGSDDLFKDTDNSWEVYLKDTEGNILGGQTCLIDLKSSFYCEVSGVFQESGIDTSSLSIGILCTENSFHNCPGGATIHEVRAELDYATVTISDPIAPTNVTGAAVPSGLQAGTVSVLGSATDSTAGLLSLSVVNGAGEVVGGPIGVPGSCDYSLITPCPTAVSSLAIPVDTTKLPNGQDQIRVEATNAAHDEGFSVPYTLTVQNESSHPGTGGSGGQGSGGSSKSTSGTSSGQGSGVGSSSTSTGQTSSGGAKSALVPVRIHLDKVKRAHSELVVSGHLSPALTGSVKLTLQAAVRGGSARALTVHVVHGRFRVGIRLFDGLRKHRIELRIVYRGDKRHAPAVRAQMLRAWL